MKNVHYNAYVGYIVQCVRLPEDFHVLMGSGSEYFKKKQLFTAKTLEKLTL